MAAGALVVVAFSFVKTRVLAPYVLLAGAATVAGLAVAQPWLRLGLLELGAALTVALVWQTARAPARLVATRREAATNNRGRVKRMAKAVFWGAGLWRRAPPAPSPGGEKKGLLF